MAVQTTQRLPQTWLPQFLDESPLFGDLKVALKIPVWSDWPNCEQLMALIKQPIYLESGKLLTMMPQDETLPFPELGYEQRIFKHGIVSTRLKNWHDIFNAFIWALFPQTKMTLNTLHAEELLIQKGQQRTPARDAITHLDESGIIIASSNLQLLEQLKNHHWHDVFVSSRHEWHHSIDAFIFGHGMYEKAFNPFIGFTGKAYCIQVDQTLFDLDKSAQYSLLDRLLATHIKQTRSLRDSSQLSPLPMLGVPGWWKANTDENFYNNLDYFRPKRSY